MRSDSTRASRLLYRTRRKPEVFAKLCQWNRFDIVLIPSRKIGTFEGTKGSNFFWKPINQLNRTKKNFP